MASPNVLDLDALLAPIAEDQPAGEDLRADASPSSPYYQIREARHTAREAERRAMLGEEGATDTREAWKTVAKLAPTVLAEKSKDLTIASFYVEALLRQHGFAGLRDGFRLLRGLVEQFWDDLYPRPDEDGVSTRVAPLAGLNGEEGDGTLIEPISKVPLTNGGAGPFALWQYQQACEVARIDDPQRQAQRVEQGAVALETVEKSAADTSPEFFLNLLDDLSECDEEFAQLCTLLDEKCGEENGYSAAPPSSNIRNALEQCRDVVKSIARNVLPSDADESLEEGEEAAGPDRASAGDGGGAAGPIRTREDAFRTLTRVAEFFRRTEPHTPVSYALEQAVRWGRMPLPELLTELIGDSSTRHELFKLIGVTPPPEEE